MTVHVDACNVSVLAVSPVGLTLHYNTTLNKLNVASATGYCKREGSPDVFSIFISVIK